MKDAQNNPYTKSYQPENENFINLEIELEGYLTMIDGLLVNIINDCPTSTSCPFCHIKQTDFNKKKVRFSIKSDSYIEVGMSILHFGTNAMKAILKLASQLDFKKHRCEGKKNQKLRDIRKAANAQKLWDELGIKVNYWFNVTGLILKLL